MDFNSIASDTFTIMIPFLKLAKDGMARSMGADIWELIKKPFKLNEKDKKIVEELEENPNDMKLQGKAELRLAQLLEENPIVAEQLVKCIKNYKEENQESLTVKVINSKNSVVASKIHVNNGDFIVGSGNRHGK